MKFFSDGAYLLIAQLAARLLAFSLTFVVAHMLGLEQLALLGLAQSLIGFATVAGDAGLGTSAVQRISRGADPIEVARETARAQIWISIAASVVMIPIVAAQAGPTLAVALCLTPVIVAATATYVLQARLMARQIALGQIVGNVFVAIAGITLAALGAPIGVVAAVYPAGLLLTMLVVNARAGVRLRDMVGAPDLSHYRSDRRSYLALLLYTLVVHAYSACLLVLGQNLALGRHFEGAGLASRMLILLVIPGVILGSMLLPRFSSARPSGRRLTKLTALAFIAGSALAISNAVLAPVYVPLLFGSEAVQYVSAVQAIGAQVPLSFACTVLTSASLAERKYLATGTAYVLALATQIAAAWLFEDLSTGVFVSAITVSEAMFLLVLIAQRVLLRGRSA